ncbi:acyltransferase [Vibrio algarum]|uniref:Acyltransferase n=1 Tax=Vibrio algarum TaxID=3020714 RepID=A0ABT4YRP3_9VIBR|nr:acyltransferase [Vibrio sp. KJ40-1]MDB1123719.1 acyltransferase [Vibrio sp. KJ40-1]
MIYTSFLKKVFGVKEKKSEIELARESGVIIGKNCRFVGNINWGSEPYLIRLGDHVSLTNVTFVTHDGGVWVFREAEPEIDVIRPINVGNNVFIGHACIIMPGVKIGDNVVIGAGAVVTKNVPSNSVAIGVPAKVLKNIDEYRASLDSSITQTKYLSSLEKKNISLKNIAISFRLAYVTFYFLNKQHKE